MLFNVIVPHIIIETYWRDLISYTVLKFFLIPVF